MMARTTRGRLAPYGVLAAGLVTTAAATVALHRAVRERDMARFSNAVQGTQDRIEARLETYVALLLATRSYFFASNEVERNEFHDFIARLDLPRRYPGVQGVGFSRRIAPAQKAAVEEELRASYPGFRIWPEHERDEYHAITYLEPLDRRNREAIGYDMFTEPVRNEAMARARDTGLPATSRKVTLVQEIDKDRQAGFLIYVPVYSEKVQPTPDARRAALRGFVYSPFRAGDLFEGIFGREQQPRVAFEVFDGVQLTSSALMHREDPERRADHEPSFETVSSLEHAGVTWTLRFRSTAAFDAASSHVFVPGAALLGIGLSFAFFFVNRAQVRARARAEQSEREARAARAEAETERNNLQQLFTQAPAAVAVVRGPELRYELSNPVNQLYAGGRQLLGRTVQEALPEFEAQGMLQLAREVQRTGQPYTGNEVPVIFPDQDGIEHRRFINFTYQPLRRPDGAIDGIMVFAYEVTKQVQARREVEALAEELSKSVKVRDDFLSIAGHELRTPLAALTLQIDILLRQAQKGAFEPSSQRLIERLNKAAGQIERLDRLITELLDVSRITSGRLTLQPEEFDLTVVLGEVVDRFAEQLSRAGCPLLLNANKSVVGRWDRIRLDQVITNLIANALRYGEGKPIQIYADANESTATVSVRDHGIGIALEDQERIFRRFERAVSERNYGGLGLGLWITDQIVRAHGGAVRVESQVGEGSTFTVTLPLTPAIAPPADA